MYIFKQCYNENNRTSLCSPSPPAFHRNSSAVSGLPLDHTGARRHTARAHSRANSVHTHTPCTRHALTCISTCTPEALWETSGTWQGIFSRSQRFTSRPDPRAFLPAPAAQNPPRGPAPCSRSCLLQDAPSSPCHTEHWPQTPPGLHTLSGTPKSATPSAFVLLLPKACTFTSLYQPPWQRGQARSKLKKRGCAPRNAPFRPGAWGRGVGTGLGEPSSPQCVGVCGGGGGRGVPASRGD